MLREGLASVLYEAERPRVKWLGLTIRGITVKNGVQGWVVVHLKLAIKLETATSGEHLGP